MNILFVAKDAFRAGAQMELLHIIRWLRDNTPHRGVLLLREGGDLLPDFEALIPTVVWEPHGRHPTFAVRLKERVKRRLPRMLRRDPAGALLERNYDLVYVNSVSALDALPMVAKRCDAPVVCHVHELEASIRRFCGLERFEEAKRNIARFIAASGAVRRNLVTHHGLSEHDVELVYEAVYTRQLAARDEAGARAVRTSLEIPEDAFVVGGCGTMDWRKAPDVFLQVARRAVRSSQRPVHFLWVGGALGSLEHEQLREDAQRLGIDAVTHFVGPQRDPVPYFSAFDVFFLSSREDPFPLVCLEAAALGLPILCFEDSGGMPELVEDDAGVVLPYLDAEVAAQVLVELAGAPDRCRALGARAAAKVRERYDIDVTGAQVRDIVERVGGSTARSRPA